MFDDIQPAPADAIFGLAEQFRADPNPEKINLILGVYQDSSGKTPILDCIRAAQQIVREREASKSYLPIDGLSEYNALVARLVLGEGEIVEQGRFATVQTPGGSGALRLAGDLLFRLSNQVPVIWMSNPTWANHRPIFEAARLKIETYPILDPQGTGLDFSAMMETIEQIPAGDALLLHTVCHNPTGVDLSPDQWRQLAACVHQRRLLPIFDFAYQGFGESIEADRYPIQTFAELGCEPFICSSFSKNMGLYSERVGALTMVGHSAEKCQSLLSHMKVCARCNYSNPPRHGASLAATVLGTDELRQQWVAELEAMRQRINETRQSLIHRLNELTSASRFDFVGRQRGMFSYSGLTPAQTDRLRETYSIYIVGSGRINVAGVQNDNLERLCTAIAAVTQCPTTA